MESQILVIDDSLTVRKDLEHALTSNGYVVTLCATLEAARKALAQTRFTVVILDVLLPDGDGIHLLAEIKASPATANIPVLLLTSETQVRDRIRGLKIGAFDYIGKPYDLTYVLGRVHELTRVDRPPPSGSGRVRILLIDDSLTFREEFKSVLQTAGYTVVTAATGEEGLQLAAHTLPSLVLVDAQLPGIDGPTVIRRLRMDSALRKTPCLLLTAMSADAQEITALDSGADAFATKDANFDVILARITALLRNAGASPGEFPVTTSIGPKKILAIDDSRTYLQVLAEELRQEGYDVVTAGTGEEALELLSVQSFDAVLLDLNMPGMSGQETCLRIKRTPAWRDMPLIILTAMTESDSMITGINAGADDYISKSSDFEVLKARLRAQLRRKQFEDENRKIREQLLRKEVEAAEARAAKELAETRARLLRELGEINRELEAFSYAVSHDLRAPLRAISGYTNILLNEHSQNLDPEAQGYLKRIFAATGTMGQLIDDLLVLSRVTRRDFKPGPFDLAETARQVAASLLQSAPLRKVDFIIPASLTATGDESLVRIALENLFGNAFKYTSKHPTARIEFGVREDGLETVYFVQDDGAGFDMAYVNSLFHAFQRLHGANEFEGTGIGLATVSRVIRRHSGRIWAEAAVEKGARFFFTLGNPSQPAPVVATGS